MSRSIPCQFRGLASTSGEGVLADWHAKLMLQCCGHCLLKSYKAHFPSELLSSSMNELVPAALRERTMNSKRPKSVLLCL